MTRRILATLVLLLISGAVAWWSRERSSARATRAPLPPTATAELRTVATTVTATGIIRLRIGAEVRVGSQVSGIVKRLNVTVGSHIRQGEVIAEIDASGLQARLAQARAQVAVAEQDLRRAEVDEWRARRLDASQLVPRQQLEDASLGVEDAREKLTKAQRDADVVSTDLAYAVIRAPISGTVASVSTQEGETVAASFTAPTFVTIIGDRALQLVAMVDETDIGAVARGNHVTFTVETFPDREFAGRVDRVAPKATIVSGVVNYEVIATITSSTEPLKPDMTANITIKTAERQALVVPAGAVRREGDVRVALVERDGAFTKRTIAIGARDGDVVEVRRGLAAGDRVAIELAPGGKEPQR